MDKKRTMGFIGICRKAGKLCCGHDAVKESVVKNRAVLVFFSSDASERLKDEMKNLAIKSTGTKRSLSPFSSDEFFSAIGKKSSVFSVTDEGFANKIELMFGEA